MKKIFYALVVLSLAFILSACEEPEKHVHSYSDVVVEATCTERGYTEHKCECGESYKDNYVSAKGHSFGEWQTVKEATIQEEGLAERSCACGEKESKKIAKLEHTHAFQDVVVEPTCTERGYTEHKCECGESYKDQFVEKLPHDFGEWKTLKEATYTEEGLKERECECGEKEQEVIDKIPDTEAPVIVFENENSVKLNTFKTFDPLEGVSANDAVEGDLTEDIIVEGAVDNTMRGTYILKYRVKDSSGNEAIRERRVDVIWDYQTSFIGHGGCYYGVMNSEEAILYAAKELKYQAIEIDLKVTKDGVFVLSHDDTWGSKTIASTNYDDLKTVVKTTSKSGSGTYPLLHKEYEGNKVFESTICTLERYLEICKEYNVRPVIELKGGTGINNSDQSNMARLMKTIEDAGLIDECILLGSAYKCLIWTREHGYENVECQYLVDSCANQTYLDRCIQYDLDISICVTYGNGLTENTPEWIAKYQAEGLKVSTYTFTQYTDYPEVQKWINIGVDFVTVDWHTMSKLQHIENAQIPMYTVSFMDQNGELIKEVFVKEGRPAGAPKVPEIPGYEFIGWDKDISSVKGDMTVTAKYELVDYEVSYNANLDVANQKEWASKEDFVNDFYSDMFEWFKANAGKNQYITIENGAYKVVRNSTSNGTATFTSAADIKALNVYVFECALSSFMYKPIEGTNSNDYVPEEDANYFLNTEPYRTKYQNMNKYLLNCINTQYTAYSKTFNQASNNRVQIFFRFHQWCNGTNISSLNEYPTYYEVTVSDVDVTLPEAFTYTIEEEVALKEAKAEGKTFLGWYLEKECINKVEKIEKGTYGDITLYAKWQ